MDSNRQSRTVPVFVGSAVGRMDSKATTSIFSIYQLNLSVTHRVSIKHRAEYFSYNALVKYLVGGELSCDLWATEN